MEELVNIIREEIAKNINEKKIEEIKQYIRKLWKKCSFKKVFEKDEIWPKTIIYENEDSPFIKAEFYEDGTAKVWPRRPLQWVTVTLTCPKDMKFDDFKEIVEESVEELGRK